MQRQNRMIFWFGASLTEENLNLERRDLPYERENKFLSKEICQSKWVISTDRSVNWFWNWILGHMT
jgi:hypothetical protein